MLPVRIYRLNESINGLWFLFGVVYSLIFFTERINISFFFEPLIIWMAFLSFRAVKIDILLVLVGILAYLIGSLLLSVFVRGAGYLDFLMSYKFVFYFASFFVVYKRELLTAEFISRLYYFLIAVFFVKYLYLVVMGLDPRPVVFVENNFELMFILLLALFVSGKDGLGLVSFVLLIAVVVLSGSRSAALSLAVMFVIQYFKVRNARSVLLFLGLTLSMILIAGYVWISRGGALADIDRFRFLMVFLQEYRYFNVVDVLFGKDRLSPLTDGACSEMAYYSQLFSYKDSARCYSVVLHSFHLRVLYDHGLIVYLLAIYAIYLLLKTSGYTRRMIYSFLAVVMINGLSVSSLNSVFFALPMILFLVARKRDCCVLVNYAKS